MISSSIFNAQFICALPAKTHSVFREKTQHHLTAELKSMLADLKAETLNPPGQTVFLEPGFCVSLNAGRIELTWATKKEKNNFMFTIQKTQDIEHFENVCTSMASRNSSSIIYYKETDYNPYPGLSYYRLMITDREGHSKYSCLMPVVNTTEKKVKYSPGSAASNDNTKHAAEANEFTLILLRDKKGQEYYSKFAVVECMGKLEAFDIERKVSPGKYEIVSSSNDKLYGKSITIK
jgi:hypothetical protein